MTVGVSAAALWGRIALHNKLLTQKQWEECVEVFRKMGGKTPIDKILIHKGYLQEKHADLIRKKVQDILDKQGADGGAAVATATATAPPRTHTHAAHTAAPPPPVPAPAPGPASAA